MCVDGCLDTAFGRTPQDIVGIDTVLCQLEVGVVLVFSLLFWWVGGWSLHEFWNILESVVRRQRNLEKLL